MAGEDDEDDDAEDDKERVENARDSSDGGGGTMCARDAEDDDEVDDEEWLEIDRITPAGGKRKNDAHKKQHNQRFHQTYRPASVIKHQLRKCICLMTLNLVRPCLAPPATE